MQFIVIRILKDKKKCIKTKCEVFLNKIVLEGNYEFPTMDLLRVRLVFVKESWDIRISLNIMRSTQVFNEVLYKNSYFILKRYLIKNVENGFWQNKFLIMFSDYTCEFSKMDSYYVTVISGRRSWGTIGRIKYSDCIRDV